MLVTVIDPHGNASQISVDYAKLGDVITLEIEDSNEVVYEFTGVVSAVHPC